MKEKVKKDYFYYDFGEGKVIEKIPFVSNAYEWEEKQLIPILNSFDIFGTGVKPKEEWEPRCEFFDKGSRELQFVRDVIYEYGSISFGKTLTIGLIQMTDEEYNNLKEY